MKIYIAGKRSGDKSYREKFQKARERLKERYEGDAILTPAELPEGMEKADYMRICFAMIDTADCVVLLPDWADSSGARVEYEYCRYIGKRVYRLLDGKDAEVPGCCLRPVI